jgi:phosphatidylinositol-3-phosphatase
MHGGVSSAVAADGSDGTPCPFGSAKDDANDASLKYKADVFVRGAVTAIQTRRSCRPAISSSTRPERRPVTSGPAASTEAAWSRRSSSRTTARQAATSARRRYNHYSLLATIEQAWGLGYLGNASDRAQVTPMTEFLTK